MIDPILISLAFRFRYKRLWSRGGHTFASALPVVGCGVTAVGRDATDALLALLARAHGQTGAVDA